MISSTKRTKNKRHDKSSNAQRQQSPAHKLDLHQESCHLGKRGAHGVSTEYLRSEMVVFHRFTEFASPNPSEVGKRQTTLAPFHKLSKVRPRTCERSHHGYAATATVRQQALRSSLLLATHCLLYESPSPGSELSQQVTTGTWTVLLIILDFDVLARKGSICGSQPKPENPGMVLLCPN